MSLPEQNAESVVKELTFNLRKEIVPRRLSKDIIGSSVERILTWALKVTAYSLMKQAFI
jgi:hypothetical protein